MRAFVARPDGAGPHPGIVVFQEAFGVNSHIRDVTARFAREGFVAIAPELFHRTASGFEGDYADFASVMPHFKAITTEGMAADARAAADAAVSAVNGDRFVATWDALQYLSARVEALERRVDPLGLEAAEWPVPSPDVSGWHDAVRGWLGDDVPNGPVIVGESGDGALVTALRHDGREVLGIEPRGSAVWTSFDDEVPGIAFDHVDRHLRSVDRRSVAGVVLIGCIDRADLAGKVDLLDQALRITRPGGVLVLLGTDPSAWDGSLTISARDLAPGRPFHPETWCLLLRRAGFVDPVWHRSDGGIAQAVVARVER